MGPYERRPARPPRRASSAVLTRGEPGSIKMLMGLRHPDVPTFPEFWSFPGGGVSKEDITSMLENPEDLLAKPEEENVVPGPQTEGSCCVIL